MTELQLPPPPVETPDIIDDEIDIPDMVAHLYMPFSSTTMCGIKNKNDPHDRMHRAEKLPPGEWAPGRLECPSCGAPCCDKCNALALKAEK